MRETIRVGGGVAPNPWLLDTSQPKGVSSPVDPTTLTGVTMANGDFWYAGAAQAATATGLPTWQSVGAEATGRPRTVVNGNVTLSGNSPRLVDADVHGLVNIAAGTTSPYMRNVHIRGYDLSSAHVGESGAALIKCNAAGITGALFEDITLIPDFPSVDWDGIYGHDYTLRRALIAHVTDGAGVFNTAAPGTNVNVEWDQVYCNWLAYFSPSIGSSNPDKQSHNDCMQILGGGNIWVHDSTLMAFRSMPDGWIGTNGRPNPHGNDPFGYVGNGASPTGTFSTGDPANPSNPQYPANTGNSAFQFNNTQGTPSDVVLERLYLDGGAATVNISVTPTGASRLTDIQFGRNQWLQRTGGDDTECINGGTSLRGVSSNLRYADTGNPINWR